MIRNSGIYILKLFNTNKHNSSLITPNSNQLQLLIHIPQHFIFLLLFLINHILIDLRVILRRTQIQKLDMSGCLIELMQLYIFCSLYVIRLLDFAGTVLYAQTEYLAILDEEKVLIGGVGAGEDLLDSFCFQWRVNVLDLYFVEVFCVELVITDLEP